MLDHPRFKKQVIFFKWVSATNELATVMIHHIYWRHCFFKNNPHDCASLVVSKKKHLRKTVFHNFDTSWEFWVTVGILTSTISTAKWRSDIRWSDIRQTTLSDIRRSEEKQTKYSPVKWKKKSVMLLGNTMDKFLSPMISLNNKSSMRSEMLFQYKFIWEKKRILSMSDTKWQLLWQ